MEIININSNGKTKSFGIEPEYIDIDVDAKKNGVYRLYFNNDYIGDMAFHQENQEEWIYTGFSLNDEEQEQIAQYIQTNMDDEIKETSFYAQAFYKGSMNSFEIIPNEGHFGVAYSGNIIAEIQHNEDWEQTSGEPLDEEVFTSIVQRIEDHYE